MKKLICILLTAFLCSLTAGDRGNNVAINSYPMIEASQEIMAEHIAVGLSDPLVQEILLKHLDDQDAVPIYQLHKDLKAMGLINFSAALSKIDQALLRGKNLDEVSRGILQLRLVRPDGPVSTIDFTDVPVIFRFDDAQKTASARFSDGSQIKLDASLEPGFPVLVVEVNTREEHRARQVLRDAERGIRTAAVEGLVDEPIDGDPIDPIDDGNSGGIGGGGNGGIGDPLGCYGANKRLQMLKIEITDTFEGPLEGTAELYAVVVGLDLGGNAKVRVFDLTEVDHANTTYYLSLDLLEFETFWGKRAHVMLFEQDKAATRLYREMNLRSRLNMHLAFDDPSIQQYMLLPQLVTNVMAGNASMSLDDLVGTFVDIRDTTFSVSPSEQSTTNQKATADFRNSCR